MLKDFYKKAMDIVFVNFLWILTSLFGILITTGAATTAMFKVMHQIITVDEPTSVWNEFKTSFKTNFWFSTLIWLGIILLATGTYFAYIFSLNEANDIMLVLTIVGTYQILIFTIYFFPTLALFKTDRPMTMIKNVVIMSNTNIWTNIKVLGSLAFVAILVLYVHPAFLVIAFGIYGYLVSFHLQKTFRPYLSMLQKS